MITHLHQLLIIIILIIMPSGEDGYSKLKKLESIRRKIFALNAYTQQ
jgi:hypothetical protein